MLYIYIQCYTYIMLYIMLYIYNVIYIYIIYNVIYIILINIIYIYTLLYIDMLTKGSSVRSPGALTLYKSHRKLWSEGHGKASYT